MNQNFFSKPDLLNSYWAGFIAADGCVQLRGTSKILRVLLNNKDKNHILKFNRYIKGTVYSYSNLVEFYAISEKLCDDLKKNFNITPRKSLTLKPPKGLTKKQTLAYIAGYIDGDGCIRRQSTRKDNRLEFKLLGTKAILLWVHKNYPKNKSTFARIPLNKQGNVFAYRLFGKKAEKYLEIISQLNLPFLNRKWRVLKT